MTIGKRRRNVVLANVLYSRKEHYATRTEQGNFHFILFINFPLYVLVLIYMLFWLREEVLFDARSLCFLSTTFFAASGTENQNEAELSKQQGNGDKFTNTWLGFIGSRTVGAICSTLLQNVETVFAVYRKICFFCTQQQRNASRTQSMWLLAEERGQNTL